jgi:hypothetical protein
VFLRLVDDEDFYTTACQRAKEAGKWYDREAVVRQYVEFFERIKRQFADLLRVFTDIL